MHNTSKQYDEVIAQCRELFINKMKDYGPSWRILRPRSVTDQIFIKAKRIRTLELNGETKVGEDIWPEFVGIINYGIIGLIQLRLGCSDTVDISNEQALSMYDELIAATKALMIAKNTDYGEAWRDMRISSYTDLILTKIQRTKEIENHDGVTLVSEGIDANYQDMINYSVFALIKHNEKSSGLKTDEWQVKSRRSFNEDELNCFTSAVCVASQWGKSVCFRLKTGYKAYIPLTESSALYIGQEVDPAKCVVLKLHKPGEDDINCIEYKD